jgi:hypothetical protein
VNSAVEKICALPVPAAIQDNLMGVFRGGRRRKNGIKLLMSKFGD